MCEYLSFARESTMEAINYTTARNQLAKTMERVNADHAPVIVTRQNGEPVVIMSLADFNALQETAYLLRSPANAERLARSVRAVKKGRVRDRRLING
jgi:antitoxin YefM